VPGSRATRAISIPAVGAFFRFRASSPIPDLRGPAALLRELFFGSGKPYCNGITAAAACRLAAPSRPVPPRFPLPIRASA
jgi:hypothetical protein